MGRHLFSLPVPHVFGVLYYLAPRLAAWPLLEELPSSGAAGGGTFHSNPLSSNNDNPTAALLLDDAALPLMHGLTASQREAIYKMAVTDLVTLLEQYDLLDRIAQSWAKKARQLRRWLREDEREEAREGGGRHSSSSSSSSSDDDDGGIGEEEQFLFSSASPDEGGTTLTGTRHDRHEHDEELPVSVKERCQQEAAEAAALGEVGLTNSLTATARRLILLILGRRQNFTEWKKEQSRAKVLSYIVMRHKKKAEKRSAASSFAGAAGGDAGGGGGDGENPPSRQAIPQGGAGSSLPTSVSSVSPMHQTESSSASPPPLPSVTVLPSVNGSSLYPSGGGAATTTYDCSHLSSGFGEPGTPSANHSAISPVLGWKKNGEARSDRRSLCRQQRSYDKKREALQRQLRRDPNVPPPAE